MHDDTKQTPPALAAGTGSAALGIPSGCHEAPGFILDVFDGSAWVTRSGEITTKWEDRGVWPTVEAAESMMRQVLLANDEVRDRAT